MSRRKNRERAEAGLLFRNGHYVRREEVEEAAQKRREVVIRPRGPVLKRTRAGLSLMVAASTLAQQFRDGR